MNFQEIFFSLQQIVLHRILLIHCLDESFRIWISIFPWGLLEFLPTFQGSLPLPLAFSPVIKTDSALSCISRPSGHAPVSECAYLSRIFDSLLFLAFEICSPTRLSIGLEKSPNILYTL